MKHRAWLLTLGLLVFGTGCGTTGSNKTAAPQTLPAERATAGAIEVTLREFAIQLSAVKAESGLVDFKLTNGGKERHEFVVVPFDRGRYGLPIGEHETMEPGDSGLLRLRLSSGRYRLVCLVTSGSRGTAESHMELGMMADFTVKS